jgi:hypothetical protein
VCAASKKGESKAIPVADRGDLQCSEMSRIAHFLTIGSHMAVSLSALSDGSVLHPRSRGGTGTGTY